MSENIERSLGRIEGLLTKLDTNFEAHLKSDTERFKDADTRIKSLETARAWTIGAGATVSVLVAGIITWLKG